MARGFVLSFAILTVALFILVFAQIQSDQLYGLRYHDSQTWEKTLALRVAQDVGMDLNALLHERVSLDQNSTNASLFTAGTLPTPLAYSANILRYQRALASYGRDLNLSIFADFNAVIADGNLVGVTNTGFAWKRGMDTNRFYAYPQNSFARPHTLDINLDVDYNYVAYTPWTLNPASGDIYVQLRYSDTNSQHDQTSNGWVRYTDMNVYSWQYRIPTSGGGTQDRNVTLTIGQIDSNQGSLLLDNNAGNVITVNYSFRFGFDANTFVTRAGYMIPLSVIHPDANVSMNVQYVYE